MKRPQLNLADIAIGIAIATVPYWAGDFLAAQVPLWAVVGTALLAIVVYLTLAAARRTWQHRRRREKAAEEREQELLVHLRRLCEVIEGEEREATGDADPSAALSKSSAGRDAADSRRGRHARRSAASYRRPLGSLSSPWM